MHVRILGILAAAALLAACSSTPEEVAELKGAGGAQPAPAAQAAPPTQQAMRPAEVTAAGELAQIGDRVLYETDQATLTPTARGTVEKQAAWMKKYPRVTVTIEGHCDERGTREYNLALGERRAIAVKNYLVSLGVEAARIKTISYGKERPAVVGSNEQAWSQNRRGVTVVN
ncbi:MAG: peptidoglycan-associated lipoprotein Pal [Alphaproteobacteria bacterium]|nr:peptidoglycan-associated lipoprotein Pal [Alphaproteobacteria bacterium]